MTAMRIADRAGKLVQKSKAIPTLWRRIRRVYQEFADARCNAQFSGFRLTDAEGRSFGEVRNISLRRGRMHIIGAAQSATIDVVVQGGFQPMHNLVKRPTYDGCPEFKLSYRAEGARAHLKASRGGMTYLFTLPVISQRQLQHQQRQLVVSFVWRALYLIPHAIHWQFSRNPRAAARIRSRLGLLCVAQAPDLPALCSHQAPPKGLSNRSPDEITIVITAAPRRKHLSIVLGRLLANTDLQWQLLIVADRAGHPQAADWLVQWRSELPCGLKARVRLFYNGKSDFGPALDLAEMARRPLVWMQGNAILPKDWAPRLLDVLQRHRNIASVRPFTGSAGTAHGRTFFPGQSETETDHLDASVKHPGPGISVGADGPHQSPLIMISPHAITQFRAQVLSEETSDARFLRVLGRKCGRHVVAGHVFVGSLPGVPHFDEGNGPEAARPAWQGTSTMALKKDPLLAHRLAFGCALAGRRQTGPVPVYLAHSMGGGAEHYLAQRISTDISNGGSAIVLRVGGARRWQVELHSANGCISGASDSLEVVEKLLCTLPSKRIIYSCGVGDVDPYTLPHLLLRLARQGQDQIEVLFHDYFPISPSFNLLGQDRRYFGLPDRKTCNDTAHQIVRPNGTLITLHAWRKAWDRLLLAADQVTVFSQHSRGLVERACPGIAARLSVQPHNLSVAFPRLAVEDAVRGSRLPVIGVLGNVSYHKGAAVLQDLSRLLAQTGAARLVIIGNSDPAFPLIAPAHAHGNYEVEDIPDLVLQYGIDRWFMPSIWPETFHYATHEALATGLPVFTFDLGAQAEAARNAAMRTGAGGTIPLHATREEVLRTLLSDTVDLRRAA